ncbi:MAG: type II secretion system GspH family protein [Lentisphaeraceae bacterium]|nr:type II secretion system GspH family protein [Lentisphaeraceae bacterium]
MKENKKFTLLELLVVIAVIALLISILMPSLSKAKVAAFDAACKSNLRQVTIWGFLYTKDWGVLPHNGPSRTAIRNGSSPKWYENLSIGYWESKTPEGFYVSAIKGQASGAYTTAAESGPEQFWSKIKEPGVLNCPQLVNNGFKWWWQGVGNHYSMNRWMGGRRTAGSNEGPSIPRQHTLSSEAWWFSDGDLATVGEGYSVYNDYSLHNPQ